MSEHGRQSTAVMARRASPRDDLDFFPTPPWATRALTHLALPIVNRVVPRACEPTMSVWDPCCGQGHMSRVLGAWFYHMLETDIVPYGDHLCADFLDPLHGYLFAQTNEWIVMNPPFSRADAFVNLALERARCGVAVLARAAFCEGQDRWRVLFGERPPQFEFQFVERVPMHKGRWVVNGSTATSYVWLVWLTGARPHALDRSGTQKFWLPPCRAELSRPDDPIAFGGWYRVRDREAAGGWRFVPAAEHLKADA